MRFGAGNDANRARWVAARLREVPAGGSILDVGAGELRFKPDCAHLRYVAQDFGRYDGRGDGQGLQTTTFDQNDLDLLSDAASLPVRGGSFDAVLCTEVLEHVPDPIRVLRELSRVLRPGGRAILTTPFVSLTHFSPYHYHTGFSRYWYEYWLPRCGLRIVCLEPQADEGFYHFVAQELGRVGDVWHRYGEPRAFVRRAAAFTFRAAARPVEVLLGFMARRSRSSSDLCTHRWCCVAEREPRVE